MSDELLGDLLDNRWLEPDTKAPYDGIRGELPDWIPGNFHYAFHAIRSHLQDYSHNDVLRFLADTRNMWESCDMTYPLAVPDGIQQDIFTLDHFQQAVNLGPEKGMALLTDPEHGKRVAMGEDYSRQQSEKASKPRGKVSEDGETIEQIVGGLALRGEKEKGAKELWTEFYGELDCRGLDPKEITHPTDLKKCAYEYATAKGKRKPIKFGSFAKVVSAFRTGKKLL